MGIDGIILWHENKGNILHGKSWGKLFLLTDFTTEKQEEVGHGYTLVSRKHILISISSVFVSIWLQALVSVHKVSEWFSLSLSLPTSSLHHSHLATYCLGDRIKETESITEDDARKAQVLTLNSLKRICGQICGLWHVVPKYKYLNQENHSGPLWGSEENIKSI